MQLRGSHHGAYLTPPQLRFSRATDYFETCIHPNSKGEHAQPKGWTFLGLVVKWLHCRKTLRPFPPFFPSKRLVPCTMATLHLETCFTLGSAIRANVPFRRDGEDGRKGYEDESYRVSGVGRRRVAEENTVPRGFEDDREMAVSAVIDSGYRRSFVSRSVAVMKP